MRTSKRFDPSIPGGTVETPSSLQFSLSVFKSVTAVLLQQVTTIVVSALTFVVIANVLGKEGTGLYALLLISTNIVAGIGNLGLKSVMVRLIARYQSQGDELNKRRVFWTSLALGSAPISGFSVASFYLLDHFQFLDNSNLRVDPWLFLTATVLFAFRTHASGGLEGLKRFERLSAYIAGTFIFRRLIAIALLWKGYGITGILTSWIIGEGACLALIMVENFRDFKTPILGYNTMTLERQGFPLFIADLATISIDWGDRVIVIMYGLSQLSLFHIAATGAAYLNVAASSILVATLPHLSEAFHDGGSGELARKFRDLGRYVVVFSAPISIGGAALAQPLVSLLFREEFFDVAPIFAVMGIGVWISALSTLIHSSLIAAGYTKEVMYATLTGVAVDIIFLVSLFGEIGMVSTGIARAMLYVISFLSFIYFMHRKIGFEVDWNALWKSYFSSTVMGIAVYLLWLQFKKVTYLPLYVAAGILIYIVALRVLRVTELDEVAILRNSLPENLRWIVKIVSFVMGIKYSVVEERSAELMES